MTSISIYSNPHVVIALLPKDPLADYRLRIQRKWRACDSHSSFRPGRGLVTISCRRPSFAYSLKPGLIINDMPSHSQQSPSCISSSRRQNRAPATEYVLGMDV